MKGRLGFGSYRSPEYHHLTQLATKCAVAYGFAGGDRAGVSNNSQAFIFVNLNGIRTWWYGKDFDDRILRGYNEALKVGLP